MFPLFSKIWLINAVLAALLVFSGMMGFEAWSQGDRAIPEPQSDKRPAKAMPVQGVAERVVPPEPTFAVVVEKNLFSSSRTEAIPEKSKSGPPKVSEKTIYLYGVVVAGHSKQALISNPDPGPAAGKRSARDKWIKVGDTLGNFSVADIRQDRIILAEGATQHEILLYDAKKPARQTVVAPPVAATPTVVTAGAEPAKEGTAASAPPATPPPVAAPPARAAEGKSAPEGEYRIVNTPFGQIKRRIP